MKSKRISPNPKTFTALLLAARNSNNADLAWKTLSVTIPEYNYINPTNPIFERIVRFVAEKTFRKDILSSLDDFVKNPPKPPSDQYSDEEDQYSEDSDYFSDGKKTNFKIKQK